MQHDDLRQLISQDQAACNILSTKLLRLFNDHKSHSLFSFSLRKAAADKSMSKYMAPLSTGPRPSSSSQLEDKNPGIKTTTTIV